jgi:ribosomal protein S18 acetylase RimI-like enzyme
MPEGKPTIRRARPRETDAVAKLLVRAFAELEWGFYWPKGWDHYLRSVADVEGRQDQAQLWVAVLDGSIVGSVDYYPPGNARYHPAVTFPADWAAFRCLAVDPERRGAGVGRVLVQHLVALARRGQATHLVLHSIPPMTVAVGLYQRMGFTRLPSHDFRPRAESPHRWLAYGLALDG